PLMVPPVHINEPRTVRSPAPISVPSEKFRSPSKRQTQSIAKLPPDKFRLHSMMAVSAIAKLPPDKARVFGPVLRLGIESSPRFKLARPSSSGQQGQTCKKGLATSYAVLQGSQ